MKIIQAAEGVRDLFSQSAFKDELNKPGTDIYDPEEQRKLIGIAPALGYGLVDRAGAMYQQQQQRAQTRLLFLKNADESAHDAYTKALPAASLSAEGTDSTSFPDYTKAHAAANDAWQNWRILAGDQYGADFASKLPQVWKLDDFANRYPVYNKVLDASREPYNLIFPDGFRTTASLLNAERVDLERRNPGVFVTKMAAGKDYPGRMETLTPEQAQKYLGNLGARGVYQRDTATGDIKTVISGEQQANMIAKAADDYTKHPDTLRFQSLQQDYGDLRDALGQGTRASHLTALIKWAKMHNPTMGATEGDLKAMNQAQMLPAQFQGIINKFLGGDGLLEEQAAKDILAEGGALYQNAVKGHIPVRQNAVKTAMANGLPSDQVVGGVPMRDEEFSKPVKLPARPEPALGIAHAQPGTPEYDALPEGAGYQMQVKQPDGTLKWQAFKKGKPTAAAKPQRSL